MRWLLAVCVLILCGCGTKIETKKNTVVGYEVKVIGQGVMSSDVKRYDYFVLEDEQENRYLIISDIGIVRMDEIKK